MIVMDNDRVIAFDCDDTLVLWHYPGDDDKKVACVNWGCIERLLPHTEHIKLLKQAKSRGMMVIVWSQAGYEWAEEVVKKLGLTEYVDLCLTKPYYMVDDICPSEWTKQIYREHPLHIIDFWGDKNGS